LYGSSGNGGLPHLSGELLNLQAAITTRHAGSTELQSVLSYH
jgi:hypothetical protein